jgi:broad specificity phosphatase PhoE
MTLQITLLRHAEPDINVHNSVSPADFTHFLNAYDKADIRKGVSPPTASINIATAAAYTVCSPLKRSVQSAKALGIESIDLVDDQFRECEMPHANFLWPKLAIKKWMAIFRLLQLCGYHKQVESFSDIKLRSKKCSKKLMTLSTQHPNVLFVGHGMLNYFIHKQLIQQGWSGDKKSPRDYWAFNTYTKNQS